MPAMTKTAALTSTWSGTPDNGANVFTHGLDPDDINEDWMEIDVVADGPSVTDVDYTSLSADKTQFTLTFVQLGSDTASVELRIRHSSIR